MASLADVEIALSNRFSAFGYTYVSWPNGPEVSAPAGSTVYEVDILHSRGMAAAITHNAADRYYGYLQVKVLSPASGAGVTRARTEATAIMAQFKKGTVVTHNGVNVSCYTPTMRHLDHPNRAWYCIVVECPWWADVYSA